jgi:PIN domain nuclease of toxin-antitoxin system
VRFLLDSHTLLWFYLDAPELSITAKDVLTDTANVHFVSPVTYWEIAIKLSIGKLRLHEPFADFIQHAIHDNGFTLLGVEPKHAAELIALPHHHRDPFDRFLVAQAIVEQLPILSADKALDAYPVQRTW